MTKHKAVYLLARLDCFPVGKGCGLVEVDANRPAPRHGHHVINEAEVEVVQPLGSVAYPERWPLGVAVSAPLPTYDTMNGIGSLTSFVSIISFRFNHRFKNKKSLTSVAGKALRLEFYPWYTGNYTGGGRTFVTPQVATGVASILDELVELAIGHLELRGLEGGYLVGPMTVLIVPAIRREVTRLAQRHRLILHGYEPVGWVVRPFLGFPCGSRGD